MMQSRVDYVIHVPEGARAVSTWPAQLRPPTGSARVKRLVGDSPTLTLEDFDLRPGVARTRVTLTAEDDGTADMREMSFAVDRNFANMLKPHDAVHVATTWRGGLGVSVLRHGVLIAAAGAVTGVPLGPSVSVRMPADVVREAHEVFRRRDPEYELWEWPVEVATEAGTRLLHRARIPLGRYEFFVVHGFISGIECLAITFLGVCPDCAATLTAPVLDAGIKVRPFGDPKLERETNVLFALESARVHFEAGDLDAAEKSAFEVLICESRNEQALALLEDIDRRRER